MIPIEERHHYYGHVEDLRGVDMTPYFLLPLYVILIVICLVTGLWPLLLLFWLMK